MPDNEKVIYFAYGSNLLFARLHARALSIKNIGVGVLSNHRLSFNKPGGDGSGKCGIESVDSDEMVIGALYEMDRIEKPILDKIEGSGFGYIDRRVEIKTADTIIEAFTYYPSRLDCEIKPYDWYKAFVLLGAKENHFPAEYIKVIEAVEVQIDSDLERRRKNIEISESYIEAELI